MKNLKLFTGQLLVETASLFPELRVLKYLPSKKAVQKEWQGEFDTPTRKFLKELWELVNNKKGSYNCLFSERLEINREHSIDFSLESFVSNFLISSKRLGSRGKNINEYVLFNNNSKDYEVSEGYISSKKSIYLQDNYFFSTVSTGLNCSMGKTSEGMMLIFKYEFENHTAGKTNDELYDDLSSQIRIINILSSNSKKYTFFDKIVHFKMEDRDDNAYLEFIMHVDFILDIDLFKYDRSKVENWGNTDATKYEKKVFEQLKIELKKRGIEV